ncbi:triose-phosphate isomerase [Planctomycetota bacterium]|nr:triose-phosphate isomerase [Planctomycetota bacterium]
MAKIIAGNWKMNLRLESAAALAESVRGRDVWVFPSFTLIGAVSGVLGHVGAQDLSAEADGAFTGDVSAEQLLDAGCSMVLVGHSERRHGHSEQGPLLRRKLERATGAGLRPLFCVGELLAQRESGNAEEVIREQLMTLQGLNACDFAAIAYEPVWAIGTGKTASSEQANDMHRFARGVLKELGFGGVPLLYGGSAKPENAAELLACEFVDGLLVGGASLKSDSLSAMLDIAQES